MTTRNLTILIAACFIRLVVFVPTATTQQTQPARRTIFSTLKMGQAVTLREKGNLYEISTMDEISPLTHRVVEVGDDYIVLRDASKIIETRIPVTAIRGMIHLSTREK